MDTHDKALDAAQDYIDAVKTVRGIEAEIEEAFPEEWALREKLRSRIANLEILLKTAIRESGKSTVSVGDFVDARQAQATGPSHFHP